MFQKDLIDALAAKMQPSVDAHLFKTQIKAFVDAYGEVIAEQLESGGEFAIPGIGKFAIAEVKERTARNPKTGESIRVPASKRVKFNAFGTLKERINN